ncbi:hypothetical protein [Amycolatopsis keratiniphila]|uniref:hypothetical protein n=1 Tax=Amycolatopsis keratiniphila TaxID=129921 RepID=UPI00087C756C|nr:hypothetical protein [Amycolatopsis keratiniphila]OLZ50318.1 hypothetical protein BS330_29085 [Amycolatopsis keratiniphila subsp. nogabecina]SDU67289.1 hypothetical protein SAMN04489733_8098 [Amycolatopsis keratiniphila]
MTYALAQVFTEDVEKRLDDYDAAAERRDPESLAQLALGVPLLTGALRTMLAQHQVDSHGDCTACPRPRWRTRTRCQFPRELSGLLTELHSLDNTAGKHVLRPNS